MANNDKKRKVSGDGVGDRKAVLQAILERLKGSRDDAKNNDFRLLAYLIDMAVLEAKDNMLRFDTDSSNSTE